MYTISINGTQLTFDDQGLDNGPAILLLTGWGHDHRAYDEILPYLVPHHRVIRMDWRGHGLDRTPVADFGPAEQFSDVVGLLNALSVRSFVPVAHAHAGWTALELADRLGTTRVPAVMLVDLIVTAAPLNSSRASEHFAIRCVGSQAVWSSCMPGWPAVTTRPSTGTSALRWVDSDSTSGPVQAVSSRMRTSPGAHRCHGWKRWPNRRTCTTSSAHASAPVTTICTTSSNVAILGSAIGA